MGLEEYGNLEEEVEVRRLPEGPRLPIRPRVSAMRKKAGNGTPVFRVVIRGADPDSALRLELPEYVATRFPYQIGRMRTESSLVGNDLVIADNLPHRVSRHHAAIVVERGEIFLRDLQSHAGCRVNGEEIGTGASRTEAPLRVGLNRVEVGGGSHACKLELKVEIEEGKEPSGARQVSGDGETLRETARIQTVIAPQTPLIRVRMPSGSSVEISPLETPGG